MGLATAHRLFQTEYPLLGFSFKPAKALLQEGFHPFCDKVFLEEFRLD